MARVVPHAEIFVVQLQQWITSFFSLTLATNIICTAIVVYRIWDINRESIVFAESSLRPIMLLVIESGAIYSATLTLLLILYKVQSWFQYVILDAISPIVGLVFSMIIIRIGLGLTSPSGETNFRGTSIALTTITSYNGHGNDKEQMELGFVTSPQLAAMPPDVSVTSSQNSVEFRRELADKDAIFQR